MVRRKPIRIRMEGVTGGQSTMVNLGGAQVQSTDLRRGNNRPTQLRIWTWEADTDIVLLRDRQRGSEGGGLVMRRSPHDPGQTVMVCD